MIKNIAKKKTLMELEECMKESSDFPFTGLSLDQPWRLNSARAMEFFRNYGATFTRLQLGTSLEARLQNQAPFLNDLPRLSILGLRWPGISPQLSDSAAGQEDARTLNLPSLRTLRIYCELNEDILSEVCMAASGLLRIECHKISYTILKGLKCAGKLQAVSVIHAAINADKEEYALRVDQLLSTETPALTQLDVKDGGCISRNGLITLLLSSQQTLQELILFDLYPSEFSEECPVLPKLTTLTLFIVEADADEHVLPHESIFRGRQGHKFPTLKEMTLYNRIHPSITVNFSDGLFIVPSLRKMDICGCVNKAGIEDVAQSFPNVIEVRLNLAEYNFDQSWNIDPTDIWSVGAFKKLEKLVIWPYTIQSPTKFFDYFEKYKKSLHWKKFKTMNMDSFLTGIPIGICENLRKHNQQNLKDSLINEILRDSPSLLQLKNLKELVVCVRLEDKSDELPEEPPFISMVWVRYALQMIPEVTAKFVYDRSLPAPLCYGEEDRDTAVTKLKDAFKHVQPYVELEPFFY